VKRFTLLASSFALLAAAGVAQAAPDGVPARPMSIGNWANHDPDDPYPGYEPWTPSDVAGFLQLYQEAYFELGYEDGKPPGVRSWKERGAQLATLEQILAQRGVDARGRICMSERADVMTRMIDDTGPCNARNGGGGCDWEGDMDGSLGEREVVVKTNGRITGGTRLSLVDSRAAWQTDRWYKRLVVLRPGLAGEERRRVTANDRTSLSIDSPWRNPPRPGDQYEVRGSFDPAWVIRVTETAHRDAVKRIWEDRRNVCGPAPGSLPCAAPAMPLDPFASGNTRGFQPWMDRGAIAALRTGGLVPAIYGSVHDSGVAFINGGRPAQWRDPYFSASGVVMDLSNPAYREWRVRYLLYKLADHGIVPGESTCLSVAYKPGYYGFYDEQASGPSPKACSFSNTSQWIGPAAVCTNGSSIGGPLHPTLYAPRAFEGGLNAYFRELVQVLAANGYADARIITAEAPPFRDAVWTVLADDVKRDAHLAGEQGGWIEPPLSAIASLPSTPTASTPTPSASGAPQTGAAPMPTAAEDGDSAPVADDGSAADSGGSSTASAPAAPDPSGAATGGGSVRSERRGHMSSGSGGGGGGSVYAPGRDR
jgi:hypothetical protein